MSCFDALYYPAFTENYESGFPDVRGMHPVIIQFRPDEVEFKIVAGFTVSKIILKPGNIIEVGLNEEKYQSTVERFGKEYIDNYITGGVAVLTGSVTGFRRKPEDRLSLVVDYLGAVCEIRMTPSKNISAIYAEFKN